MHHAVYVSTTICKQFTAAENQHWPVPQFREITEQPEIWLRKHQNSMSKLAQSWGIDIVPHQWRESGCIKSKNDEKKHVFTTLSSWNCTKNGWLALGWWTTGSGGETARSISSRARTHVGLLCKGSGQNGRTYFYPNLKCMYVGLSIMQTRPSPQ
jgi:hypothetical protein